MFRSKPGIRRLLAACFAVLLGLSACSKPVSQVQEVDSGTAQRDQATQTTKEAPGSRKGSAGVTLVSMADPFMVDLKDAMKQAGRAQGLELAWMDPHDAVADELAMIEDLIDRPVEVILMAPVDESASQEAAEKVHAAGIPLVLVNTRFEEGYEADWASFVGPDDVAVGELQANHVNDELEPAARVLLLTGEHERSSTDRRTQGFFDAIGEGVEVEEREALGSRERAKVLTQELLEANPEPGTFSGIVAQNDEMAIGASEALAEAGRQTEFKVIMGVDGLANGLEAIAEGTITATVFQDVVQQADEAVKTGVGMITDGTVESEVIVPVQLVTDENLEEFLPR